MTKHKEDCKRVFKNYDNTCPRCQELSNGATARDGWQKRYYEQKRVNEVRLNKVHDCKASNCGIVCTFGEW